MALLSCEAFLSPLDQEREMFRGEAAVERVLFACMQAGMCQMSGTRSPGRAQRSERSKSRGKERRERGRCSTVLLSPLLQHSRGAVEQRLSLGHLRKEDWIHHRNCCAE